jgi:hypothetical protein
VAGLFLDVFSRRFLAVSLAVLLALEFLARLDRYFGQLGRRLPDRIEHDKIWLGTGETGSAKNRSKPAHRRTRPAKAPSILNCGETGSRGPLSNPA